MAGAILLASGATAGRASADDTAEAAIAVEADTTPARELPRYDGREAEPADLGDVLIWVPRILFSPLYLVSEYLVRRPLGALVTAAERADLPALLVDFFTFGDEQKVGLVPTALIDFGFKPSVGLYFFADDLGVEGNDLRVRASFWGPSWLLAAATDRYALDELSSIALRLEFSRRPDWLHHGLGYASSGEYESRYAARSLQGHLRFDRSFWRASRLTLEAGVQSSHFEDEACCDDPTLEERVRAGEIAMPPGYERGFAIYRQAVELAIDSRRLWPAHGGGFRVEARGEQAWSIRGRNEGRWIRYGGAAGVFIDLTGKRRVVGLSIDAEAVEAIDGTEIPFTELAGLGGQRPLRGFLEGRLLGRSAVAATLEYRWPIWVFLDGSMHFAMGNVFGERFDDFELDRLRMSFGLGARGSRGPDHSFDLLIALGTEPIDHGAEIDSVRFVLGATTGF